MVGGRVEDDRRQRHHLPRTQLGSGRLHGHRPDRHAAPGHGPGRQLQRRHACPKTERRGAGGHTRPASGTQQEIRDDQAFAGKSLSRRRFFKMAGGATVAAAGMGVLPTRSRSCWGPWGFPRPRPRASRRPTCSSPAPTAGSACRRRPTISRLGWGHDPSGQPGARRAFTTYIFGFRNVTGLDDTQRADQKNKAQHTAPMFWVDQFNPAAQRVPDAAHQPGPGAAPRPVRRAHHPLARLPQRHPVLRRRADRLGRGDHRAHLPVHLPSARPRHLHVPLPRGGRRARPHGHDRPGVRAAAAERQRPSAAIRAQVRLQRRRRLDRLRPRVLHAALRGVGRFALGRRAHPAARVERLPRRLLPAERARLPRHAGAQLRRSTRAHPPIR